MKIQSAKDLKPSKNEISHIQVLIFNEKYGKKMVHQFSMYLSEGQYHLAEGMIFNENQNHKVVMSNKSYEVISNYLMNAK